MSRHTYSAKIIGVVEGRTYESDEVPFAENLAEGGIEVQLVYEDNQPVHDAFPIALAVVSDDDPEGDRDSGEYGEVDEDCDDKLSVGQDPDSVPLVRYATPPDQAFCAELGGIRLSIDQAERLRDVLDLAIMKARQNERFEDIEATN